MLSLKPKAPLIWMLLLQVFLAVPHASAMTVVLVPGLGMEGGLWRSVSERLKEVGIDSRIVQLPFTAMKDDLAATRRVTETVEGPHVLVGHSYGGMLISQAAKDGATEALIYVAAFQPEEGESLAELNAKFPPVMSVDPLIISEDGHFTLKQEVWMRDVANGLVAEEAAYWERAQAAANIGIFSETAEVAGWKQLPVWSVIATEDRTVSPDLQRFMSKRSDAQVVELGGGHLLPLTHAAEITDVIVKAVDTLD